MNEAIITVICALTVLGARAQIRGPRPAGDGWYALAEWVNVAAQLTVWRHVSSWVTAVSVIVAVYFTWWWWRGRRDKRKRVMEWIGAKSRALRDALVRKLRDLRVPGGVPRLQPA